MDQLMLTKDGAKELHKIASAASKSASGESEPVGETTNAGCTANVVMITKAEILCANAGDSRAVLSKKGKVKDLSVDHKPDLPTEKRRIERANGFVEEGRVNGMLALSRSWGDIEDKTNSIMKPEDQIITAFPDITVEKITNESDFIICACDGIWDCLTS
jgi:protein phosphatase 2C family protein 2/3